MLLELHLAHKTGYTKILEMKRVIKMEYLEDTSKKGTGTNAQLNKDSTKHTIGDKIKNTRILDVLRPLILSA